MRLTVEKVLHKRRNQNPVSNGSGSDLDLIASILPPSPSNTSEDNEEDDSETDEILRSTTLLLLRLCFAQANSQLQMTDQELELLRSAPPAISSPRPEAARAREEEDERRKQKEKEEKDMWTLDTPTAGLTSQGPLLDPSGKVCNTPLHLFFLAEVCACSLFDRSPFYHLVHPTVHACKLKCFNLITIFQL